MGRLSDLSVGGCRITSPVSLAPDDAAVFTMYFKSGSMTLPVRVVAVGPKSISVRFENMTASLQYQLNEFLETLNRDEPLGLRAGR